MIVTNQPIGMGSSLARFTYQHGAYPKCGNRVWTHVSRSASPKSNSARPSFLATAYVGWKLSTSMGLVEVRWAILRRNER
jgi:hypothetical protein